LTDTELRHFEADNIRAAIKEARGKVSGPGGAAELLGMKATTLASRIKALGIND
jgi:transcriptional regulator with GAF, ATPase, and Fis domain